MFYVQILECLRRRSRNVLCVGFRMSYGKVWGPWRGRVGGRLEVGGDWPGTYLGDQKGLKGRPRLRQQQILERFASGENTHDMHNSAEIVWHKRK